MLTFGATKNGAPASEANMVFTILPERLASGLKQRGSVLIHYAWFSATRFRCNWGTTDEAVEAILADARELLDACPPPCGRDARVARP